MKGFTLLEMLITLALIVMLSAIAVPSLRNLFSHTTNTVSQSQLLYFLQQAQQHATASFSPVSVCLSADGKTCSTSHPTKLLSFSIRKQLIATLTLSATGTVNMRSYPFYRDEVRIVPASMGQSDNGTFWYCNTKGVAMWAVVINQAGEAHAVAAGKLECA